MPKATKLMTGRNMFTSARKYQLRLSGTDLDLLMNALSSKQVALYELLQEVDKENPMWEFTDSQISLIEDLKCRLAKAEETPHLTVVK
jgi:hypothetical protein